MTVVLACDYASLAAVRRAVVIQTQDGVVAVTPHVARLLADDLHRFADLAERVLPEVEETIAKEEINP